MEKILLETVEVNPAQKPIATVILLHGLGADGHDFASVVPELNLPEELPIRFVFPHAPVRPITINGGHAMRAWYDIDGVDLHERGDELGIRASAELVHDLIEQEKALGIAADKIILAGFSQGGAMALHCGLRYPERLAGILALSSYLPLPKKLANEASKVNQDISIFMAHGSQDAMLPLPLAQASCDLLTQLNYSVDFRVYPMPHSVCMQEISDIVVWLEDTVK